MPFFRTSRRARLALIAGAAGAVLSACWSTTEPSTTVGGRTIVYGRITDPNGAGVAGANVFVRHHPATCDAKVNESSTVQTAADGRYRVILTAVTAVGCVSVRVVPVNVNAYQVDSVMNLRAPFRQSEPLDSLAVNLTLRGGIQ